ncbi:peptidylprolyl isomerase [Pseudanabaena sp. PCC 6802]|uniref:peptidylprolyl isomerase n=1 Tax=Pseudanabaena sp. PCC 6802 TaxID=118173 RepID=UPI00034BAF24|nr:peptidylprolyl isomerase [Pseudanabaena sp. PCC 6802]
MPQTINIAQNDILHQVKLSCQIPALIDEIVTRRVIASAIADAGIKLGTEELQERADRFRLMLQLKSAEDTFAWLQKHSLTVDDFEEMISHNLMAEKLAQHLFSDAVETYFIEHYLDYTGVAMYEIVLDDEDLALEIFYAIQEDEMSFSEAASQYIQDAELRRKGGYLGVVRRFDLKPEISAAVFAAKPPQMLKPIVATRGVHLIKLEELLQPQLDERLRDRIVGDLFRDWIKQETEKFEIVQV